MIYVKRPVLLDASLTPVRTMNAESLNLSFNSPGVSQATMVLPPGEPEPPMHAWVNLYNQNGFRGVFRVTTPQTDFFESQSVTLRHGIDVLADAVCAEQSEFSGTVRQLLIKILSYQTQKIGNTKFWTLGTCEDTNTIKRSINYDNLLDLIAKIEEEEPDFYFVYDQSSFPWTLHFLAKPANEDTEFRINRGIRTISRTRNDNELCTQLILSVNTQVTTGTGDGASTETVSAIKVYNNAAAQAIWGVIQKTADIDTGDNLESQSWPEADAWAAKFLSQHSAPADQIQISGDEFKRVTGDAWDEAKLGHVCRVPLPDKGVTISDRAVNVTYPDALGDPTNVTLSLANQLPKFSSGIASLKKESAATAASARASTRAAVGAAKEKDLKSWSMVVRDQQLALDGTGIMELYESGISMDAQGGVKIYSLAQGFQSNYAAITVNNEAITSEVQRATANEGVIRSEQIQTADRFSQVLSVEGWTWQAVTPAAGDNPKTKGWYELVEGVYVKTNDTSVVSGKTYYVPKAVLNQGSVLFAVDEQGQIVYKVNSDLIDMRASTLATWGVYSEDTLTAGVIAEKLSNSSNTYILGDQVYIGNVTFSYSAAAVPSGANPRALDLFELKNGSYVLTKDESPVAGKTYYTRSISTGTTADDKFVAVNNLIANKIDATTVSATYATITNLNAQKSRIDNLIAGDTLATKLLAYTLQSSLDTYVGRNLYVNNGLYVGDIDQSESLLYGATTLKFGSSLTRTVLANGGSNFKIGLQKTVESDGSITISFADNSSGNYNSVNFSRAVASWTMGWSGGTFTAKANPQNQSCSTQIVQGTASWNGTTVTIPIEAIDSDNPNYQYATGRSVVATYSGGGSGDASDINLANSGSIWTHNSWSGVPPALSGITPVDLNSLSAFIADGNYGESVIFRACIGPENSASSFKYYRIKIGYE